MVDAVLVVVVFRAHLCHTAAIRHFHPSAWLLSLKYPHLVVGSIASSAPVRADLDFNQYLVTVADGLGSECANVFGEATTAIESMWMNPSGLQQLSVSCRKFLSFFLQIKAFCLKFFCVSPFLNSYD